MLQPVRNVDALSNKYTDNLYEYAPRPRCKGGQSAECGNTEWVGIELPTLYIWSIYLIYNSEKFFLVEVYIDFNFND
jgi:hypothetical protein